MRLRTNITGRRHDRVPGTRLFCHKNLKSCSECKTRLPVSWPTQLGVYRTHPSHPEAITLVTNRTSNRLYSIRTPGHPGYLSNAVRECMPTRELHSSDLRLLAQTRMRTTTARRAFNYAAPAIWHALLYNVRTADSLGQFRSLLRTHFYRLSFYVWSRDFPLPRFTVHKST